jgi:triosephosphate isomerase (TIM)
MKKYRKKIVAGNWKMNKTATDAAALATDIQRELGDFLEADVVLCPPFTALKTVGDIVSDSAIKVGAQNMHWESAGAYTGEISAGMLRDLYCHFVILGHSERRQYFGETDETVQRKVRAALAAALTPIVCVGETLEQREQGETEAVIRRQVMTGLADLGSELRKLVVAYEPVWAIGTGRTASPEQAQEIHAFIRGLLTELADADTAATIRIQYGGSMKPDNAGLLMSQPDIDGGLIGGAALDAKSFVEIIRQAGV